MANKFNSPEREEFYEVRLQEDVMAAIKRKYSTDVWFYKAHDAVTIGIPDIIMCFYGHFVAIELKRRDRYKLRAASRSAFKKWEKPSQMFGDPFKDATPMQKYNVKKINLARGTAFVARDLQSIMDKLERLRETLGER